MRRIPTPLSALVLGLLLPLGGCGDDVSGVGDTGRLTILLTDAPGDVLEAWVTISRIEAVPAEGTEGGIQVLMDTPVTTDLLTLQNDVATLVSGATLPAGSYSELRFVVPESCLVVEVSGTENDVFSSSPEFDACGTEIDGSLLLPSGAQTGLKVQLPGGSVEVTDDLTVLLVDFDVAQSFGQQAGQSGMWVMTPVITATEQQP